MIDNIELIKPLLDFSNEDDFYVIHIMRRQKDLPELEKINSQSVRTIKSYTINSLEYLEKRYEEMKIMAEIFKARVYIQINKQSHENISFELLVALTHRLKNRQYNQKGLFDSVVGKTKRKDLLWVVDVDTKDETVLQDIEETILNCRPVERKKILAKIPTKNGFHIISKKFEANVFKAIYPNVEPKKSSLTLLYFPSTLE